MYVRCPNSVIATLCPPPPTFVKNIKWMNGVLGTCLFARVEAKLGQENLLRMVRWHCPPDTGFEIRALAVWGRARYLLVTESPQSPQYWIFTSEWGEGTCFCEAWTSEWRTSPRTSVLAPPTFVACLCHIYKIKNIQNNNIFQPVSSTWSLK